MIHVIQNSNLLDIKEGIVCHQVNCVGKMGAGIALQIRNKWPKVYEEYVKDCEIFKTDPRRLLGHVQDILLKDNLIVANCFAQIQPGNGQMTDYNAWDIIIDKLKDLSNYFNLELHFPWMIGCGLAGGDWKTMLNKFDDAFSSSTSNIYFHSLT